jgi:hypothetical protein
MPDDKILGRIAAALRTAENAGTEDEAANAMAVAQRLATTYSVDLAVARSHSARQGRRPTPAHRTVTLGEAGKRGLRTYVSLFLAIADANDVTCNIAHNSTYVIAFGFEDDIALCEALYASLVVQMVRAGDAYLKAGSYKDELVFRKVTRTDSRGWRHEYWDEAPVPAQTARATFHLAFAGRVRERLVEAQLAARAAAIERDEDVMARTSIGSGSSGGRSGTELAIIEKLDEVAEYYQEHSNARGAWRGNRGAGAHSRDAHRAGDRAGRRARLGTEPEIGGQRRALGA